jgi:TM2 domain-containing membrane protein YozV
MADDEDEQQIEDDSRDSPPDDQRPPGDQQPPGEQRPPGDQRRPRDQQPPDDQRPPRDQQSPGEQRPPGDQRRPRDQQPPGEQPPPGDQRPPGDRGELRTDEKFCSDCGAVIHRQAEICPECGVRQHRQAMQPQSNKDRTTAAILALLLGGVGAHKFYLDESGLGILYLCFFWTGVPAVIGIVEGIIYLTKSDQEFQHQHA